MLIFRNPGLIDLEAVRTLGVSVKREGSFGRFGTGLKFALATILRGGGEIDIWRGHEIHRIGTVEREIRGSTFQLVTLDDEPMGITTALGRDWEPWMVLRELGCNALDEGGSFMPAPEAIPTGADRFAIEALPGVGEDETVIVVEWPDLDAAYRQRKELFLEGEPLWQSDKLRLLPGPAAHVFYRGVRVYKLEKPSAFTIDVLAEQVLTEDRTLSSMWAVDWLLRDALLTMEDKAIVSQALTAGDGYHEHKLDYESASWGTRASKAFLDAAMEAREGRKALPESARKVLLRHIREAAGEEHAVGGSYRRAVDDRFSYAIDQLDGAGVKFAEDQQFIIVDEMPSAEVLSMVEGGRVYVLRELLSRPARDIAAELLIRWVDLNVQGYGMEDAVRLLSPIILDACPSLKRDEKLIAEDEGCEVDEGDKVDDAETLIVPLSESPIF